MCRYLTMSYEKRIFMMIKCTANLRSSNIVDRQHLLINLLQQRIIIIDEHRR